MDILANLPGAPTAEQCQSPLNLSGVVIVVVVCCALGILWAAFNFMLVRKIDVEKGSDG